jgi:lipoprotein-anchoring transpeptidase ErfK/SrfK
MGEVNRRQMIRGLVSVPAAAVFANALAACSTAPREEKPDVHLDKQEGKLVAVSALITKQKIPVEDWQVLQTGAGPVVVIVDKRRNLYGLFVNGTLSRVGVAGTAKTGDGYVTTDGLHKITRLEGAGYTSREYPGAKMDHATFFGPTGRAIHASANFVWRYNKETEKKEWFLITDNSHGCVNVMDEDAKVINDAFRAHGMKGAVIVY